MHKVTVLMSTYNGEKYLGAQIDSILSQNGVDLYVLVRDDGSKDSTVEILEEYKKKCVNFDYYVGKNLGPAWSFIDLIKKSSDSDFYAFCDQDDVWDEEKLLTAVNALEKLDNSKPNMYYSNLYVTNEELEIIRNFHPANYKKENKYNVLVENMAAGCTIVFNGKVKEYIELLSLDNQIYIFMHDIWVHLICAFWGTVIYDENAYIYYRQHGKNAIGTKENKSYIDILVEKTNRFFDKSVEPRYKLANSFYNTYQRLLNEEDAKQIRKLINYKNSLKDRIVLLFDRKICAPSKKRDVCYRILIIRGLA